MISAINPAFRGALPVKQNKLRRVTVSEIPEKFTKHLTKDEVDAFLKFGFSIDMAMQYFRQTPQEIKNFLRMMASHVEAL